MRAIDLIQSHDLTEPVATLVPDWLESRGAKTTAQILAWALERDTGVDASDIEGLGPAIVWASNKSLDI